MYLRQLFNENKLKLVSLNGPSQVHLSCPDNDGSNRTVYKICLKYSTETQKEVKTQKEVG